MKKDYTKKLHKFWKLQQNLENNVSFQKYNY